MKRILAILPAVLIAVFAVGCGRAAEQKVSVPQEITPAPTAEVTALTEAQEKLADEAVPLEESEENETPEPETGSNILVVYFSRTGEQYNVGVIDKGNTAVVAEMIAAHTGADMFEILPKEDRYPMTYDELTDMALEEQAENARPEILGDVEDFTAYDTVFLGYPIWWGDLPMIVYTFLESHDFAGKTVIPFCTHEGSGLAGTARSIENTVSADAVLAGFSVRGAKAQNEPESVQAEVEDWLAGLGY